MMKRLRSYDDDLDSAGDNNNKEGDRATSFSSASSHHRRFFSKGPPCGDGRRRPSPAGEDERDREGSISRGVSLRGNSNANNSSNNHHSNNNGGSSGYDDREGVRVSRKRGGGGGGGGGGGDHGFQEGFDDREGEGFGGGFERRKGFDRYRDRDLGGGVGSSLVSPRGGYVVERERERERERVHRSESFCVTRREFPKGFRSERNWTRREDGGGGSSSWRRLDGRSKKDVDDDAKSSPVEKGVAGSGGGGGGGGGGGSSSSRGGMDSGGVSSSKESLRSPQGVKDVKSPTWSRESTKGSKDYSGGEPSKDAKKNEGNMGVESGGSATGAASDSEMEEGELQSESHQGLLTVSERNSENACDAGYGRNDGIKLREGTTTERVESVVANSVASDKEQEKEESLVSERVSKGRKEVSVAEERNNVDTKGGIIMGSVCDDSRGTAPKANENLKGKKSEHEHEHSGFSNFSFDTRAKSKECNQKGVENSVSMKCFDLKVGFDEPNKDATEGTQEDQNLSTAVLKDKGKCVVVSSPDEACIRENGLLVERNFIACRDNDMEGTSARGFELFSTSAGVKAECGSKGGGSNAETEKLKLEPLDLSLGLSNTSVPAASNSAARTPAPAPAPAPALPLPLPSSPPHARSLQSFGTTLRTGSDCFPTSISFSGSQFIHNPSCSLTHNSVDHDFEQSVKSRPLFQGVDWQALSANDTLPKEVAAKQKLASNSNGNGSIYFSQASLGILNGRAVQQQGVLPGLDRSASFQRQTSGKSRYQDDHRSPAHSAGSYDTRSEYGKDKKRMNGEESVSRLYRSISQREMEQGIAGERELVERIIYQILSESIQTMSRKVDEMPERLLTFLKDTVCEIILKEENRQKLTAFQDVLKKRSDLNLETLLKSHRVQLQILVSVKTGVPDFIQRGDSISASDLAEIYLCLKCRNITCQSALPVDECDCRFCSQNSGFCSSCMCLECSKFDTAANTCGWVGCDVCNHWCHTDCGLRNSHIKNGRSGSGAQGATEMQFYCLACDHPSEMFGFVKDVFKSCATQWKAETLKKELEYVRRVFSGSYDVRGKTLHEFAKQLILRLQMGANAVDVCKQIFGFLNESDSKLGNGVGSSVRELQLQPQPIEKNRVVVTNGVRSIGQEPIWSKPILTRPENIAATLPMAEGSSAGGIGSSWSSAKPVVDELDSIIKVKQAEADMFQKRADDARRESEGLQRIVISKNEKIEEEYASRIAKLRLAEVEERRRQKQEELQMLEKSHREYFNMKTRMEMDIKDLLLKMEATRRNLCT